jgi:ATP-dependent helicase/nuclease subunit B
MSLRFILGRAGSGKTHTCVYEICTRLRQGPDGPPLLFLVPEQATFQMERALLTRSGVQATMRAQVISFHRLAWHVQQRAGGGARPRVGELGKAMLMRALLAEQAPRLQLFARTAGQPGFVRRLVNTMTELHHWRVSPEDVQTWYVNLPGGTLLKDKLHDLALLYRAFEEKIHAQFTDPDDQLNLLAERLPESGLARGAMVWVDGFASFTPQEYRVLAVLLAEAAQVNVALCLDPSQLGEPLTEGDPFYPTRDTYLRLRQLAGPGRIMPPVLLPKGDALPRFQTNALAHLEKYYFRHPPVPMTGACAGVECVAAQNPHAEVRAVARALRRLAQDEGYRWRDMAVAVRDMDAYQDLLRNVLTEYGIPFFLDSKRPVYYHPLVELIRSALQVVAEDWPSPAIMRYLKTDLAQVPRDAVDRLENYILAHGITGSTWRKGPWPDQEMEGIRQLATGALAAWQDRLAAAVDEEGRIAIWQVCQALYELCGELDVPSTIEGWAEDIVTGRQHRQVWDGFQDLLDQMVTVMGNQALTLNQFGAILDSGLEQLRLGAIPPTADAVLVGEIERSRHPNVRAFFLLGVCDGSFPAVPAEDVMLTDDERQTLAAKGWELALTSRQKMLHEQFLAYIALTRPRERLWISFPLADAEGVAKAPSAVVKRWQALFPEQALRRVDIDPDPSRDDWEHIAAAERVWGDLAKCLRRAERGYPLSPVWIALYNWGVAHRREQLQRALAGLFHSNRAWPIPAPLVATLLGEPLRTSVSRLERFARCPFWHYAADCLKLQERAQYRVEAVDVGRFSHAALSAFVEQVAKRGWDLGQLAQDQAHSLLDHVVAELAAGFENGILLSSARYRYLLDDLRQTLRQAARLIVDYARYSAFRPLATELSFGMGNTGLPALTVIDGQQVQAILRGQIDRLDGARGEDGTTYLQVVDYKSSQHDLQPEEVLAGLTLQLPAYLLAAVHGYGAITGEAQPAPAGCLYFNVSNPIISDPTPLAQAEAEKKRRRQLRMRGWLVRDPSILALAGVGQGAEQFLPVEVNKDGSLGKRARLLDPAQMTDLLRFAAHKMLELVKRIKQGETEINPCRQDGKSPCSYCPYRAVCGFDLLLPGNGYRHIRPPADAWAVISQNTGELVVG